MDEQILDIYFLYYLCLKIKSKAFGSVLPSDNSNWNKREKNEILNLKFDQWIEKKDKTILFFLYYKDNYYYHNYFIYEKLKLF